MYRQCKNRGYATAVDVLMDIGVLQKEKYEDWRFGRIPYLAGLNPSFCCYKQWGAKKKGGQGRKPVIPLHFSKSGNPEVERWYATHFVDVKRIAELKKARQESPVSVDASSS